jgi:phosphonate transport system substrate-binding protein
MSSGQVRVGIALTPRGDASARLASAALRIRLEVFCAALQQATGLPVTGLALKDYDSVLHAVAAHAVDFAWLPPLLAIKALREQTAVPVILPVRAGSSLSWSALFCRRDSPIQGLADLKGTRIAWVDRSSATGHQVMRAWLKARNVDADTVFSRQGFVGSHDAVVGTVLGGKADVGATYAHVDAAGNVITASWRDAPVRVLGLAGPVPPDVLAAGQRVERGAIERVSDAMVSEKDGELRGAALALFEADRFEKATTEILEPLRAYALEAL